MGPVWKLIIRVKAKCYIALGSPAVADYTPSFEAAKRHERCHCEDYEAVMKGLVVEAAAETYATESKCNRAKRKWETYFGKQFNERIKASNSHADWGRWWDEKSPCYARAHWKN